MSSLLATPVSDWDSACAAIITNGNITTGLVGQYGNPMPEFNNFTWGITKEACYQFCGRGTIYQVSRVYIYPHYEKFVICKSVGTILTQDLD
jgi:hypothetical protein